MISLSLYLPFGFYSHFLDPPFFLHQILSTMFSFFPLAPPPCRWVLYVNGKERITDCPAVNTGHWYHIGVSWRSWDGDWRIYINGKPSDGGKGLSVGTTIPGVVLSSTRLTVGHDGPFQHPWI